MDETKTKEVTGTKRKAKEQNKETKKPIAEKPRKPNDKKKKEDKPEPKPKSNKKSAAAAAEEDKDGQPTPPKRAWPAFFFFQSEKRDDIKKQNPSLNQKELVAVSL